MTADHCSRITAGITAAFHMTKPMNTHGNFSEMTRSVVALPETGIKIGTKERIRLRPMAVQKLHEMIHPKYILEGLQVTWWIE